MRNVLFIVLLLTAYCFKTAAQKTTFEALSDRMFFNIFTGHPDSSVYSFIDKNFHYITIPPDKTGNWTINPIDSMIKVFYAVHSFIFTTHPYFHAKFREGLLEIQSQEARGYLPRIAEMQIWFMFDTKREGQAAFKQLGKMFDILSNKRKIFIRNNNLVAQYFKDNLNKVEIILIKDELYKDKYKMLLKRTGFIYR